MPTLIACLSSGKGTWIEVTQIIRAQPWDKIFLITNQFGVDNFSLKQENVKMVLVDIFKETNELSEAIKNQLKNQISDFEVALSLASGTGKEHMAVLKAVMELGLNFRLVSTKNGLLDVL